MSKVRRKLWVSCKGMCFYCSVKCTPKLGNTNTFTIDHVRPLSKGGLNHSKNRVGACRSCNDRKSDMDLLEFIASKYGWDYKNRLDL